MIFKFNSVFVWETVLKHATMFISFKPEITNIECDFLTC